MMLDRALFVRTRYWEYDQQVQSHENSRAWVEQQHGKSSKPTVPPDGKMVDERNPFVAKWDGNPTGLKLAGTLRQVTREDVESAKAMVKARIAAEKALEE